MPLEMDEGIIAPDIERLMQTYDTFHTSPTAQSNDDDKLSLEITSTMTFHNWNKT